MVVHRQAIVSSSSDVASKMDLSNFEFSLFSKISTRIEISVIVGRRRTRSVDVDWSLKAGSPGWLTSLYNCEVDVGCIFQRLFESTGYLAPSRL